MPIGSRSQILPRSPRVCARGDLVRYASAPPEFVKEARRSNPFNEALPRLTLSEIATEFAEIADAGVKKGRETVERSMVTVEWDSLAPNRKRTRAEGNKIPIKKPDRAPNE